MLLATLLFLNFILVITSFKKNGLSGGARAYIILAPIACIGFEIIRLLIYDINSVNDAPENLVAFQNIFETNDINKIFSTFFWRICVITFICLAIIYGYAKLSNRLTKYKSILRLQSLNTGPVFRDFRANDGWIAVIWLWVNIIFFSCLFILIDLTVFQAINEFSSQLSRAILFLFDWLISRKSKGIDFGPGYRFSVVIAVIISIFYLFATYRRNKKTGIPAQSEIFLITLILGLGFYLSLYSITNFISNALSDGNIRSYVQSERSEGLLLLRFNSITLFCTLLAHAYVHIANQKIEISLHPLSFNVKRYNVYAGTVEKKLESRFAPLNFAQTAFYVVTFAVLFYAHKRHFNGVSLVISNILLFYIMDDWKIIFFYITKTGLIHPIHEIILKTTNFLICIFACRALFTLHEPVWLILYLMASITLGYYGSQETPKLPRYEYD